MSELADVRLTEWTSCGGCAAKWGAAPLGELDPRARRRSPPTRRCSSAWRRSTTPPSTASPTTSPSCRRPTSSRRSSMIPPTSVPSPPPTRAATCSPWAAGSCIALEHRRLPRALAARGDRRHLRRRRRGGGRGRGHGRRRPHHPQCGADLRARRAGPRPSRPRVHARPARGPATCSCCRKPIGTGHRAGRRGDERQARSDRRHAHAEPGRRRGAASLGAGGPRRHRRDRATASPVTAGRWPSAAACGRRRHRRAAALRRRPGGRRRRRAHRRRPPQPRLPRRAASTRGDGRPLEALCFDPQTSGGLLAAVDPEPSATLDVVVGCRWRVGAVEAGEPGDPAQARYVASWCPRHGADSRASRRSCGPHGHEVIVGIDEVGRGAWAGPLMVGAAVLPRDKRVNGVRDSKLLTEAERERLFDRIATWCEAWAVGARLAGGVRRARHGRGPAARRAAARSTVSASCPTRPSSTASGTSCRRRRRATSSCVVKADARLPLACRRRRSSPRSPATARCAPRPSTIPELVVRLEQGLPVPRAQGGAAGATDRRRSIAGRGCSWTTSCGRACAAHRGRATDAVLAS